MAKTKIYNDPIYGFITIKSDLIFNLIEHPYFQRLRRIKQLGMTHLVYPSALHTRFQHAMGAMHLMGEAIETLRGKEVEISFEEEEAAKIAILLHDIGHGPFSHALETTIVSGVSHEMLSVRFMKELNKEFNGALDLAILIFQNNYSKKFLHQLVSSQLDVDRLDYLNRDSFYSGVSEGVISWDRIIKTLNVVNDNLVVDSKGIYSIEKFIIARRLMYWQVYLHKTVLAAENMLIQTLRRAKYLQLNGAKLFCTPDFEPFLSNNVNREEFNKNDKYLKLFAAIDDNDIFVCIKAWRNHSDLILSSLCKGLVDRKLFKIELQNQPFNPLHINNLKERLLKQYDIAESQSDYLLISDKVKNNAYNASTEKIQILFKNGKCLDIAEASDQLNISVLSNTVEKFFVCYPKDIFNSANLAL